jgi:hypothetical protein
MHRKLGLALAASVAALALALAVATTVGVARYDQTYDTETWYAESFRFVAYHDLERPLPRLDRGVRPPPRTLPGEPGEPRRERAVTPPSRRFSPLGSEARGAQ